MIRITGFLEFFYSHIGIIWEQTIEHMVLTSISILLSTITGIITGILLSRRPRLAGPILGFANVIQTIPSLALLGLLLPLLGIGVLPAVVALFLYALLPIVRNTYTGITDIDKNLIEVSMGLGMTRRQILVRIQLPLSVPVIFAGIRTAAVINIGIATLCALIGAGGLGEYIFRGISVNNPDMILAGALPAAALALLVDFLLGIIQRNRKYLKYMLPAIMIFFLGLVIYHFVPLKSSSEKWIKAGFPSEFMEREDGYRGLVNTYGLHFDVKEMEIGLMYDAIRNHDVDVISGFSTDGRIKAYDLVTLRDNKDYFPPYHAAPLVRKDVLDKYPELYSVFDKMNGIISDSTMRELNFEVDHDKKDIQQVAQDFLNDAGFHTSVERNGVPDVLIGSKAFTESFILADMMKTMIENYTDLDAGTKLGFGGTKLIFDALVHDEIDMYPEYTGTALLVLLNAGKSVQDSLNNDKDQVYKYVNSRMKQKYDLTFLDSFGFNNTFAINVRKSTADKYDLRTISDLKKIERK